MSKDLGPVNKRNWADIMNESSQRRRNIRHATRRARGENSGTAVSGETKRVGNILKMYTKRPLALVNGRTVRGHWVTAVDPEGNYGGPYATMNDLRRNPRYRSNMNNIFGRKRAPSRARSRGRSASRSGRRSATRSGKRSASRSGNRSRRNKVRR